MIIHNENNYYEFYIASTPQKSCAPQFDCTVGGLEKVTHEISDNDSNDESATVITKSLVKCKRTYYYWTLVETFENEELAYDKLAKEWKFKQNTVSSLGDKSFFACAENQKCKAGLQFFYNNKGKILKKL